METEALSHSAQVPKWRSQGASLRGVAPRGTNRGRKGKKIRLVSGPRSVSAALTPRTPGSAPSAAKPSGRPLSRPRSQRSSRQTPRRSERPIQAKRPARKPRPRAGTHVAGLEGSAPSWSARENMDCKERQRSWSPGLTTSCSRSRGH